MKTGQRWSSWSFSPLLGLLLGALTGCAADRVSVEKNLMANRDRAGRSVGVAEHYLVRCPDVLEIRLPHKPALSGRREVGPDGRIDLGGDYGRPRVEGRTLVEIARLLAAETGAPPNTAEVRVAEYRSQYLLLFGQVIGWQRAVPYRGQETVLDLLQRVGGLTPGAEPADVYVVRAHLGEGRRPEAFHVDLRALVLRHDERTNLRLLPGDHVYVGETRQAQVEKALPPWLRRAYQALWNTRPNRAAHAEQEPSSRWISGGNDAPVTER